jgi:Putative transposase/Transposase zinc-binding domain
MVQPLSRPPKSLTLGDVVVAAGESFLYESGLPFHKQRVLHRIAACGTGILGWYLKECDECGQRFASGKQCHDRNCPTCGAKRAIEWVKAREGELLPCSYFHSVFTLPDELRTLAQENEALIYNLLFTSSRKALLDFAQDDRHLGALPAMFQVLHTTTRSLDYHPHVHVAISAGGYDEANDRWVPAKYDDFLFPVRAVAKVFRGIFLEGLKEAYRAHQLELTFHQHAHLSDPVQFQHLLDQLYNENWIVYTKKAFGGPKSVIRYLGNYTHKTAIKNRQLEKLEDGLLTYAWVDRTTRQKKRRTLPTEQFLKNYTRHILPKGFHRVRHAGLLARNKRDVLLKAQIAAHRHYALPKHQLPDDDAPLRPLNRTACPCCRTGTLHLIEIRLQKVDYLKFPHPHGVALPWGYQQEAA